MRIGQSPKDRRMLAEARRLAFVDNDAKGALDLFMDVLKRWPREPELLTLIGGTLLQMGNPPEARKYLRRSLDRRQTADALRFLSRSYTLEGRTEDALDAAEKGLRLDPKDSTLLAAKANAQFVMADYDGAYATLAPHLEGDDPPAPIIMAFGRICHRVKQTERGIQLLRAYAERTDVPDHKKVSVYYGLGDLFDRTGAYDDAFGAYDKANRLRQLKFDPAQYLAAVDQICETWTRDSLAAVERPTGESNMPILIVGMPRSGTSLVEQIIASHSDVTAAGELAELTEIARSMGCYMSTPPMLTDIDRMTRAALSRGNRRYLTYLRKLSQGTRRVTDKMPTNFAYLGLVDAMLPGAKVIHCVRDPRDSCLSCFFQSFSDGLAFTCDLGDLGAFYRGYERLMAHWKEVLQVPIFDLVYADLVEDLTGVSKHMLEFLGLEWQDQCETFWLNPTLATTASLDQIRRPIFTSSLGRWKNYERHLEPLLRGLQGDLVKS